MIAKVRPAIRLRPAPALDPPYDDEAAPPPWSLQLALRFDGGARRRTTSPVAAHPIASAPGATAPGATAPSATAAVAAAAVATAQVAGSPLAGSPLAGSPIPGAPVAGAPVAGAPQSVAASAEARRAARRFLDLLLEIVNGYRPVSHVRPLSGQVNTEAIVEQVSACLGRADALRRTRQPARAIRRPSAFTRLRLLRVCEPRPGAAEVAAVLGLAERTWAVAYRLERRRGSWLCTALHLV